VGGGNEVLASSKTNWKTWILDTINPLKHEACLNNTVKHLLLVPLGSGGLEHWKILHRGNNNTEVTGFGSLKMREHYLTENTASHYKDQPVNTV
jgi:hypothetical protein